MANSNLIFEKMYIYPLDNSNLILIFQKLELISPI